MEFCLFFLLLLFWFLFLFGLFCVDSSKEGSGGNHGKCKDGKPEQFFLSLVALWQFSYSLSMSEIHRNCRCLPSLTDFGQVIEVINLLFIVIV